MARAWRRRRCLTRHSRSRRADGLADEDARDAPTRSATSCPTTSTSPASSGRTSSPTTAAGASPGSIYLVIAVLCVAAYVAWHGSDVRSSSTTGSCWPPGSSASPASCRSRRAGACTSTRSRRWWRATRAVGFPVGHASAQLAWRGLRSRPTWRILLLLGRGAAARRAGFVHDRRHRRPHRRAGRRGQPRRGLDRGLAGGVDASQAPREAPATRRVERENRRVRAPRRRDRRRAAEAAARPSVG